MGRRAHAAPRRRLQRERVHAVDERREAPNDAAQVDLAPFRRLVLPAGDTIQTGAPRYEFYFPAFEDEVTTVEARTAGNTQPVPPAVANQVLADGPYRRTWDLAQQLRRQAESQEDLVQAVLRYLRRGFAYTETPPRSAFNLEGFLFDAKRGYCQQYSGAMALLLRMAGIPARVTTGFSTGATDTSSARPP